MKELLLFIAIAMPLGCARFHDRPLDPGKKLSSFESRKMDSPELRVFIETALKHKINPWPPTSWDPEMLTLAAFYYSPDLDVARAKWETAKAGEITAGEIPNPEISFSPEYITNAAAGTPPWVLGLSLDIPVETAGKRGYRIAQAKHLSEEARLSIGTVAWEVRSRLFKSLLDFYDATSRVDILEGTRSIQDQWTQMLESGQAAGLIPLPDVTQAHLSVEETELSLDEAKRAAAEARVRVAEALGLSVKALENISFSMGCFEQFPVEVPSEEARRQALLNRTDLLAALAFYDASQSALQLEIAKQYPDIHLGPGYTWDNGQNKWSLGLSITLPIFNQNKGPIAEATAKRKEAEAAFIALQASIISETELALSGYEASITKFEKAGALASKCNDNLQLFQNAYMAGEADKLALLGVQLECRSYDLSRLEALVELQRSRGLLEDALQRPLEGKQAFADSFEKDPRPEDENEP
jgi:outer membrane protein TolC